MEQVKQRRKGRLVACEVYGTHGAPKLKPLAACIKCKHNDECWNSKQTPITIG